MSRVPPIKALLAETLAGWGRHLDPQLAAAIAFFSSLALPPLLALILAAAEALFGSASVQEFVFSRIASTVGPDAARLLTSAISASRVTGGRDVAAIVGVVGLLVAATGLVFQAQAALGHVFEWKRESGLRHTVVLRALGLAAIAAAAALSVAVFAVISVLGALDVLGAVSAITSTFAVAVAAFGATVMSYRWLSGRRVPWSAALVGGGVTTVAVLIGRYLFQVYLGFVQVGSAYGGAGSVFVLLLWIYTIALVYLVGAEISRAWMVLTSASSGP